LHKQGLQSSVGRHWRGGPKYFPQGRTLPRSGGGGDENVRNCLQAEEAMMHALSGPGFDNMILQAKFAHPRSAAAAVAFADAEGLLNSQLT
jgi:hypothetical protein